MNDLRENLVVQEILRNRVSLRNYAERQLDEQDINLIIEAAMRAPTAGNMMMYSMIIVSDQNLKERLSVTCDHQPFIAKAPLVIIFLADLQRWFDYYYKSGVEDFCLKQGLEFSGPDEADLMLSSCDALIAAENAVIAAEAIGIGSCYIGDIMENYEIHQSLLDLPPLVFPISMVCFGYYPKNERPRPRERFDSRYIVHENKYRRSANQDLEAMLASRSAGFDPHNSFGAENYGQWMYAKKTGAPFSVEMARSVRRALENWRGKQYKPTE
ncbi:nitroreductase family protein [Desulfosporosinus sp. SB140]|uniref:nitroreductase family protein n=1 Tax=Desulfosporosinus paludis TaxID=3115649 RepID=UPI003890E0FF